jgi:hypothetical protein
VDIILGKDVTGEGLRYPPLFFVLLTPFVKVFGSMLGLKIFAAIVASSSTVPMFLFVHRRARYEVAIVVTVLFTFSQPMGEMTAWGGSPNFLAITLMIFALYFLDRAFTPGRSYKWNAVAAGISVGLVFETHHLTIVVLALTIVVFFAFIMIWGRADQRMKALRVLIWIGIPAGLVALPGIPVYIRMQGSLSASLGSYGPATLSEILGPGGFRYLYGAYWLGWIVVFVLGGMAIVHSIWRRRVETHFGMLLAASTLAPLLLGVFAIREAPGRAFAFLPIPLLIGFGILLIRFYKWAYSLEGEMHVARPLRNVILTLFVVNAMLLSATGVGWMSFAVDWYHPLEKDDIRALDWIAYNTPENAVFATSGKFLAGHKEGDRVGWWIQGYSERNAVMAGSERFRLFADELESTRDMNRFFTGTHVLENGYLQVSDQYPLAYRGNPEIGVRRNGIYEPVLFLNDAMHVITYYPNSSSTSTVESTIVGAAHSAPDIIRNDTSIMFRANYTSDEFRFERETILSSQQKSVAVLIHIRPVGGSVVSNLTAYIWCPHGSSFDNVVESNHGVNFLVKDPWRNPTYVEVSILEQSGELVKSQFYAVDPEWSLPVMKLDLQTQTNSLDIQIDVRTDAAVIDPLSTLQYYNGYEILAKYNVSYLFECVSMGLEVERFLKDSDHFQLVYRNDAVAVFRVLPAS